MDQMNEGKEPIMVISSLVVETMPEHTDAVAKELAQREGVEVHETNGYKVVVTIEADTVDDSHEIASAFIGIEGVTGINLVYANFEDDPTLAKAGRDERSVPRIVQARLSLGVGAPRRAGAGPRAVRGAGARGRQEPARPVGGRRGARGHARAAAVFSAACPPRRWRA